MTTLWGRARGDVFAEDQVKKLINTKDDLIMRVPDLLKDSALLLETKQQTWKDQNKALHDRHKHQLHALKDSHESEATSIVKQYKYFLQEKENETEELVKSFNEYYEKKKREQAEYEEEMLALYELIQQLSRICHDMETGQYPVCYRLGLRCVQVPPGVKPTLPSKVQKGVGGNNKFEKLFSAIAETKRKADKYEKMMNLRGLQEPADASKLTNGIKMLQKFLWRSHDFGSLLSLSHHESIACSEHFIVQKGIACKINGPCV